MNFWDIFWLVVASLVLISYLMVLFNVIADIFRDHELSGVRKAVWVLLLMLVPAITALVYVMVRGSGMALRSDLAASRAKTEADTYIRSVARTSPAEQIATAKDLLESGAITKEDFDLLTQRALT